MLYSGNEWDEMLKTFDSLDFLIPKSTNLDKLVKIYHVADSNLAFEISRNFYTTSRFEIEFTYYDVNKDETHDFCFEEFFERLPLSAKEKVIFHLDLFR